MGFKVHISGLADGKYEYRFPVDASLFEEFGNDVVEAADLVANVLLEKGSGWMNLQCNVNGNITTFCDRCLEALEIPLSFECSIAVRHAKLGEALESTDEFLVIDHSERELDLKQFLYDNICVNIPLRKVHERGKCNPQMVRKLESLNPDGGDKEESDVLSPFAGLRELMNKK